MKNSVIVIQQSSNSKILKTAAVILNEEVEKRTGLNWKISDKTNNEATNIILTINKNIAKKPKAIN